MASVFKRSSKHWSLRNSKNLNILGYRSLFDAVNFTKGHTMIQQGWLYEEDGGRRYFVLKGSNLFAFAHKIVWESAFAQQVFDLSEYNKVKQISFNNNKFSLESDIKNEKCIFQTETNKEMLAWIRNIQCVQQNIIDTKVSFIDNDNKRTPYVQH